MDAGDVGEDDASDGEDDSVDDNDDDMCAGGVVEVDEQGGHLHPLWY